MDPNTLTSKSYKGSFMPSDNIAVYRESVQTAFRAISDDAALDPEAKAAKMSELSISSGVLCQHTALIAYERIVKGLTEPPEFVKVPLHAANNRDFQI